MRLCIFKWLLLPVVALFSMSAYSQESLDAQGYRDKWNKLIPRYGKAQFAGSIGVFSFGPGWNYSKNRLETDILFGFLPKFSDTRARVTFTLKQNYLPWRVNLGEKWYFEPLNCGLFMNSIMNKRYWLSEPSKYPKGGYYKFATKVRFNIFVGQRFTFKTDRNGMRSVSGYYEISSCDLYILSAVTNKYLKPKDYLSLALGLKIQIL